MLGVGTIPECKRLWYNFLLSSSLVIANVESSEEVLLY